MAVSKYFFTQFNKAKSLVVQAIRRILHGLKRYLGIADTAVVLMPRAQKSAVRNSIKFDVGGSIAHSIILNISNVQLFQNANARTVAFLALLSIAVVTVATSVTPYKNTMPRFESGKPHVVDVVIAPLNVANTSNQACAKVAEDFNAHMAGVLANKKQQGTGIWMPQQVSDSFPQGAVLDSDIKQYATEHQADLILYGTISCDDQGAVINPKIQANSAFFAGAPEISDFYNFDDMVGQFNVKLDPSAIEQAANQQAAHAATLIDVGGGFDLYDSISEPDLKQASNLFIQMAKAGSTNDRHGMAMLWYMAGKSQLKTVMDACNRLDISRLKQAESSFYLAQQHEPQFALAYAYLGAISLNEAQAAMGDRLNDRAEVQTLINRSLARFERATSMSVQSDDGLAQLVAKVGEAQAKLLLHDLNPAGTESRLLLEEAMKILNQVIQENKAYASVSKEMSSHIAHAYALLGDAQRAKLNDDLALSSYSTALKWAEGSRLKPVVDLSLAEMYTVRGDACIAARYYQEAAQTQCSADQREFTLQAQQMQFFCQQDNDSQPR